MKKKVDRWFEAGKPLATREGEYSIDKPERTRRQIALKSRKGNALATARALGQAANVNKRHNPHAARIMKSDADYFYEKHRKTKK